MNKLPLLSVAVFSLAMIGPLHAQGVIGPGGPYGLQPSASDPYYEGPPYYGNGAYMYGYRRIGSAPYRGAIGAAGAVATAPFRGASGSDSYAMMPEGSSYCAQRYRSYDPQSGTFLGRDGRRRSCR